MTYAQYLEQLEKLDDCETAQYSGKLKELLSDKSSSKSIKIDYSQWDELPIPF